MNHDMTTGPVWKKLLLFMLPVFGANLLQALYGTVDLMVVGQFASTADVSAVSTGSMTRTGTATEEYDDRPPRRSGSCGGGLFARRFPEVVRAADLAFSGEGELALLGHEVARAHSLDAGAVGSETRA